MVHVHQASITKDTQGNNSHGRQQTTMTNRRCQERIKLRSRNDEPMRARKVTRMMSLVN
jgi:hypothetical protein